jgi:hypothetical protein
MKSTNEQLKSRGYVFDENLFEYKNYNENELLKLLQDKEAYKMTMAVRLLAEYNKEQYIALFCEALKTETKLYTKIELCNALEKYNEKAIPHLIPLLGTIGENRHHKIEIVDINKKSYPLPRDIIGRVLIRIGPEVFSELGKILLEDKNISKIPEAIDVIGHITWNYKNYEMEKTLVEYYYKHKSNEFIEWKIVRAFQSFNSVEIKAMLENIVRTHKNEIIKEEAKRSIKRIENKI